MYQNMPTTPTTSKQTATINSSKSPTYNKITSSKSSKFVKSNHENLKPATTAHIDIGNSSDPTNEIEEISKKISEHAEALYRTWKSRGLAPTEILELLNADASNNGVASTTIPTKQLFNTTKKKPIDADIVAATNDFLATVASTTNDDAVTTEGLQQLVNSFVLKDKEQRAAGKNTLDNIMTGKSNIQKGMVGSGSMKSASSTLKSAIIMKDDEKVPLTPVKNVVVLKKTTKTPSAPLKSIIKAMTTNTTSSTASTTTTTTTSMTPKITATPTTSTSTAMLNINSAAAKTKQKIGNTTLQQQQQPQSLTTTTTTTKSRLNSKKLENSENDNNNNNNNVGATTKTKQKKSNIGKTIDGPSVEINLNMDLNLNLHINDVNNLSKLQTENLIKIKELLDVKTSATALSDIVVPSGVGKNTSTSTNALNKNINKSAKILTENIKTPTNSNSTYSNENNSCSNAKKVSNVGVSKRVAGVAVTVNDDVKNCDRNENLQVAKAKSKAKAIGNKGISDKNSDGVDSVGEVDGKTYDNSVSTKITTKSLKANKMNKNLIDDLVNNNKSNNIKITSKPLKTSTTIAIATTTTTITSSSSSLSKTTTTTTIPTSTKQSIVTSTENISAAIAAAKETKGNSGNESVLSDSTRNGNSKNRIKITTTTATTTTTPTIPITTTSKIKTADETKDKLIKNPLSTNNTDNNDISSKINSDSKSEEQKNMALVRSNSTSSMPTGSTKMKTGRSNSLTNGTTDKNNPAVARPFLTRGSVAERVMMFEKCPDARHSFLNIKRPDPAEAPPKSLLKVKLHATPPPPPDQNSLQREYRNTKSVYIPRFYFPHGKPQPQIAMERVVRNILGAFDAFPNNQVTKDELPRILKLCGIPFYWRMPVMVFCQQHNSGLVERQRFIEFWKQMNVYCHDAASRFVYILSRGQRMRSYILPEDLAPMVQDVVDTHPGLAFLKEATEFHSRYVHTVIARIFYSVNRSWSGRISISELKKSDLLEIITLLEEEDDINQIMAFFSYEHFYVIYCKFWELDKDHDLLVNQEDLARHSDHALSTRIVDRIFSGCVTRNDNKKENEDEPKMSYTDFVWFLLSEEDKRSPTAIEYWFRCMDIDGDGVLSMYELEYFYEEQQQRMESIGIETLPFEDCLCQMLDMIKPQRRDCVTLGDLKRCKMTHVFFDTFFNLEKYLDHEQRDPFASQRDEYPSDWDRFAAQEYELLITEEN